MKDQGPNSAFEKRTFANVRGLSIVGNYVSLTPEPQSPAFGTVAQGQDTIGVFNDLFRTNTPSLIKEIDQRTQIQLNQAISSIESELPAKPKIPGKFVLVYDSLTDKLSWAATETCE